MCGWLRLNQLTQILCLSIDRHVLTHTHTPLVHYQQRLVRGAAGLGERGQRRGGVRQGGQALREG